MQEKIYALVDCNNFFASCERAFRPDLRGKPIVVLSNNDGCAIARSNEAKALGIQMGEPFFKFKHLVSQHKIHVFSSNFALYADFSARVMQTLKYLAENVEVYSVDEAFLDLTDIPEQDLLPLCRTIRDSVWQWTGIPISLGLATTKTLCKVANHIAKRNNIHQGVLSFINNPDLDKHLSECPVGEVWGIGRQSNKWLLSKGIETILQLKKTPVPYIRKKMGVFGARVVDELCGTCCYSLNESPEHKKSIAVTRTFRKPIQDIEGLSNAVAAFAERAGEKLRKDGLLSKRLSVFIKSDRFRTDGYYSNSATTALEIASDRTQTLLHAAQQALATIFRDKVKYKKAGVILGDISSLDEIHPDFFQRPEPDALMPCIDNLNHKYGRQTVSYARVGQSRVCKSARTMVSPQFTTSWEDLFVLRG